MTLFAGPSTIFVRVMSGNKLPIKFTSSTTVRNRIVAAKGSDPCSPQPLALVLLGDVMLGRIVDESLAVVRPEQLWGDFLPLLQGGVCGPGESCLVAGNLECAVTKEERKEEKEFNFKLRPEHVGALKSACLSFVSLANNHSLDFGESGLRETMAVLDQQGISYAGVGTAQQAEQPAFVSRAGLKLAFFSFSDHPEQWAATPKRLGINLIDPDHFDMARLSELLGRGRREGAADLVVVMVHWGPNWRWIPSTGIQNLGRAFVDCGADIVFGHSSHHIQGIEVYKQKPIIYGAGGWIDDYRLDEDFRNDLGFLYCIHVLGARPYPHSLELIPSKITHTWREVGARAPYLSQVSVAEGEDRLWLERTLQLLCSNFGATVESCERGLLIRLAPEEESAPD